ncbi:MAG: glycosyltransferase [Clostridiaceae bacterium]|nr:glycosyltransferase [Eubacteriales bacterium]
MEKRVLIVGMSKEPGGIETFLYRTIKAFKRAPLRFEILTPCKRCAYEAELKEMGVRVFHVTGRGKNPVKSYLDKRRFFLRRGHLYDTVWLQLSSASDISAARLAKKYTRARIVCHSHSVSFESKAGLVHTAHLIMHKKNRARLAALCDACVAVTKEAGEWLYGDNGHLIVLPAGVDTEAFRFDEGVRRAMRQSLGVNDLTVVGHVGRLVPVKNQKFLLDVFAAFHEKHPDSALLIAGAGELLSELRAYAAQKGLKNCVRFLGFRSDIPALLQAFDVLLLPSLFEGFPVALAEAQSMALPCVASDAVSGEVAATRFLRFFPLEQTPGAWAEEMEAALRIRRDATGVNAALERAGLTEAAVQSRLFPILYGEDGR